MISLFFIFCAVTLIVYTMIPIVYSKTITFNERRTQRLATRMERVMPRQSIKKMTHMYLAAPVILAVGFYIMFPEKMRVFGVTMGFVGGFLFPGIYTRMLISKARVKFNNQLMDALMIMSSSFRGGLSLVQAMEAVVEEMPDPIHQEFSLVLGENKMGVTLDEALSHLYNRMPSTAVQQMTTAILLARETGGNLPAIFNRIVQSIRETKKIQQNLQTLTIQGKIQGVVMTLLPIGFLFMAYSTNPHFFDYMLNTEVGKGLLMYAAISWLIGAFLIWKISQIKEF